jgi:predicted tellurium resistance membrane protein TerC
MEPLMLDWLADPEIWIALGTLTALEIVLGIDNIIFLSVLVGRLPEHQRAVARQVGLGLAMMARLGLLFSISWVMGLTHPWVTILGHGVSGRDLILVGGGLFLMAKATHEIHNSLEGIEGGETTAAAASLGMVLVQIALLDIVFSLDSVITAVGLVEHVSIMAVAIILAVVVMLMAAKAIGILWKNTPRSNSGPLVSDSRGCDLDGRRVRRACAEGLHLLLHGLLGHGRNAQHSHAKKASGAGQTPQPLCRRAVTVPLRDHRSLVDTRFQPASTHRRAINGVMLLRSRDTCVITSSASR